MLADVQNEPVQSVAIRELALQQLQQCTEAYLITQLDSTLGKRQLLRLYEKEFRN